MTRPGCHQWHGAVGQGSGDDLADYQMQHFTLSPGQGGDEIKHFVENAIVGGGGGGVLVNGQGPQQTNSYQGQGYGGGGSETKSGLNPGPGGLPGVVLVEVVQY